MDEPEEKLPLEIMGRLAEVSLAVCYDGLRPQLSVLPSPKRWSWHDLDVDLSDSELLTRDGVLVLQIYDQKVLGSLWQRMRVKNKPTEIWLADGSRISAPFTHVSYIGRVARTDGSETKGAVVEYRVWHWIPEFVENLVLVGPAGNVGALFNDNLRLEDIDTERRSGFLERSSWHLRTLGTHTWHLVKCDKEYWAVVEWTPALSPKSIRGDLVALDFALGTELDGRVLWAVDTSGNVVGGLGTGRPAPCNHLRRCPVPNHPATTACWVAPLFRLVAGRVAADDLNITTAIAGYKDGLRGHIHGGYLLGQVALEATCKGSVPRTGAPHLVKEPGAWQAWVQANESTIREFAPDMPSADVLIRKLQHNVFQRPITETVGAAFSYWGIELPDELTKEIKERNVVAHDFVMFDESLTKLQEAADRVNKVQTLLAAAVAKGVGYDGPLVGWERDGSGFLLEPEFWKPKAVPEADETFLCRRET